jgi:hypothetical protein
MTVLSQSSLSEQNMHCIIWNYDFKKIASDDTYLLKYTLKEGLTLFIHSFKIKSLLYWQFSNSSTHKNSLESWIRRFAILETAFLRSSQEMRSTP